MQGPSFMIGRHRVQSPPATCHGSTQCQPGQVCCGGHCRWPEQCVNYAQQHSELGAAYSATGPRPQLNHGYWYGDDHFDRRYFGAAFPEQHHGHGQHALGALDDPDDGAEGGAWWNQCPDGMEFNLSTLQCEPVGDPNTPPPQADVCPPGFIGSPPACWPISLPAQPPINVPPDVPTVTEQECQARVAEADGRKWIYAGGAAVAGTALGIGLSYLFR